MQSKQQKHQVLDAELTANSERIQTVLNMGKSNRQQNIDTWQNGIYGFNVLHFFIFLDLIGNDKCPGLEREVDSRLARITEQWEFLVQKSSEKSLKLKEASRKQTFNAGVKDIEFWLGLVENQLVGDEYGRDLASVQNLLKRHQLIDADVAAHDEPIGELNKTAEQFIANNLFDVDAIRATMDAINERYVRVKASVAERRERLNEANTLFQFLRDLDDEEAWIKEKKLLVGSEDHGRDLTGVQKLRKRHRRVDAELVSHQPSVGELTGQARSLAEQSTLAARFDIDKRGAQLEANWRELADLTAQRSARLEQSLAYQTWSASVDEELAWLNEKQHVLASAECGQTLAAAQTLIKKHEAFDTDLKVHCERLGDLKHHGDELCDAANHHASAIVESSRHADEQLGKLLEAARVRSRALNDNWAMLQFFWKADVVESWISEKQAQIGGGGGSGSVHDGASLTSVHNQIAKHETFVSGLQAFENEGIRTIMQLKEQLVDATAENDGRSQLFFISISNLLLKIVRKKT